jgi:hypothetical protein
MDVETRGRTREGGDKFINQMFVLYPSVKVLYNTVQIYRKAIQMKDLETLFTMA